MITLLRVCLTIAFAAGLTIQAAAQSDNPHGDIKFDCATCHSTGSWNEMRTDKPFPHEQTGFPLSGKHKQTKCMACHQDLKFSNTQEDCASCHADPHSGQLGSLCQNCHTTRGWQNEQETFELHATRGFALMGAHAIADCQSCHQGQLSDQYAGTSPECQSCHSSDFASTTDPNHVLAGFSSDCVQCHRSTAFDWAGAKFDHPPTPILEGAHVGLDCASCHAVQFAGTPTDCYSCHSTDFLNAPDPDHEAANFPQDCSQCHKMTAWTPATFDHSITSFALEGAHKTIQCQDCHSNSYTGTPADCYSCHNTAFAQAKEPDHAAGNFDHDCRTCHNLNAWEPATFNHDATNFALTGAHRTLDCQSCHSSGYVSTPTDCYSCHGGNFAATDNPDHESADFSHDCVQCHTTAAWQPAEFDHDQTGFAITGAHIDLECQSCHSAGYANTSNDCYACHQMAYAGATDPNHVTNGLGHTCAGCHSTTAWVPVDPHGYDHALTGFPLEGAHVGLQCQSCHSSGYAQTSPLCFSCHSGDFAQADNPDHETSNFDHNCLSCHSNVAWSPATFDHNQTQFALTGAHQALACLSCHSSGYTGTSTQCYSCHTGDFTSASDPNHAANNFDHDCTSCHSTTAWSPSSFDHSATGFILTGAHTAAACISCHGSGYTNTPNTCFDCHSGDFASTTEPNHQQNNFDHDCTTCHSTTAWSPSSFDHSSTGFILTGAHTTAACISCHASGYTSTPNTCFDCHSGDFASTTEPNHQQNNFDHNCTSCHSTSAWKPANFDHSSTGFSLTGAHTSLACISCHASGYTNTPGTCFDCHSGDFASATDPNHQQNNFDHNCTTCHSTSAWSPSSFNHTSTGFPLTGAHSSVACVTCHTGGYTNTSSACVSCHQSDVSAATNPDHVKAAFSNDCTTCHGTTNWRPANWNHTTTGFALVGAHTSLQCISCHSQTYAGTSETCYGCHATDFASVTDPNHVTNGFDHLCTNCHGTSAWVPATFDHNQTQFPLTGAHAGLQCLTCHASGYANTSTACYSCHSGDFASVTNPNHAANNFDHNCLTCHTTSAWTPSTFNHSTTSFPLTGAHTGLQCIACHSTGYTSTPADCYSCHQGDFTGVTDPNHVTNSFSHLCNDCHTTTAWSPATFNHSSTNFPLTGAHVGLMCIACHSGGYVATPTLCYSCHQSAYVGTTDPNHQAANFPTDCQTCHSTSAWSPANWNHDTQYFPIYSGKHREKWDNCADCHVNSSNFAVFECIFCHEHNQTDMNDKHRGRPGYSWQSAACLNCHPDGRS